jgi:hypothetical protein
MKVGIEKPLGKLPPPVEHYEFLIANAGHALIYRNFPANRLRLRLKIGQTKQHSSG